MRGTTSLLPTGPFSVGIPDTVGPLLIPSDGGGGLGDDLLGWIVAVDVFMTAASNTNWSDILAANTSVYNGWRASTGAQNDDVQWDIDLAAGTWTFALIHRQNTGTGIYTVLIDGSSVGTIDGYAGVATNNVRSQITSIAVGFAGKHTLTLRMATKNASSSGYFGVIHHIQLLRTA